MKTLRLLLIPLLIAFIALISASIFVVKETERAVKLRFGEVVEADVPPGLHFKLPIINTVRKFDARILTLDACLLYTSPSPRDRTRSRMPSSA